MHFLDHIKFYYLKRVGDYWNCGLTVLLKSFTTGISTEQMCQKHFQSLTFYLGNGAGISGRREHSQVITNRTPCRQEGRLITSLLSWGWGIHICSHSMDFYVYNAIFQQMLVYCLEKVSDFSNFYKDAFTLVERFPDYFQRILQSLHTYLG